MIVYPQQTVLEIYFVVAPAVDGEGRNTFAVLHLDDSERSPRATWSEYNPNGDPKNLYYAMGEAGPGEQYLRRYLEPNDMGRYVRLGFEIFKENTPHRLLQSVDLTKGKVFRTVRTVTTQYETTLVD